MPDTGADASGMLVAALAMLAVGGAVLLGVRRRSASRVS
ncbi:LPXTG cell wall anchor domain-containing protein [Pseudactinotalea sp. HY160]|nr:LPXTG cell wall anchor domain-containing protein [Pseudactinotalea sp. HY160]